MQFLNKEIEAKIKRKKSASLIKKQISCGIFQDLETAEMDFKRPQPQKQSVGLLGKQGLVQPRD
ncbi:MULTISPECIES: hypothetical protein [Flavobacteriaceae]|uniref:Uncharacterized protein n=1 Tax=Flagellimonas marina TaxID=1775168 RepID=A0ABV8PJ78_9FLAO